MSKNSTTHEDKIEALIIEIANRFSKGEQRREIMSDLEALGCPNDFAEKLLYLGDELKKEWFRNIAKSAMIVGAISALIGGLITWATYLWASSSENGGYVLITYGAIAFGVLEAGRGFIKYIKNLPHKRFFNSNKYENHTTQSFASIEPVEVIKDAVVMDDLKPIESIKTSSANTVTTFNPTKSNTRPNIDQKLIDGELVNKNIILLIIIIIILLIYFIKETHGVDLDKNIPKQSISEKSDNQQLSIETPVQPQPQPQLNQQPTPNKKLFGLAYQGLSECRAIEKKAVIIEAKRNVDSGLIESVIYNDGAKRIAYIMLDARYDAIDAAIIDKDLTKILTPNTQVDLSLMICRIDEKVWIILIDGIDSQYY